MLYHTKLGLPKTLKLPKNRKKVVFTRHAKDAAKNDRYGSFSHYLPLHTHFDPNCGELVEVESHDKITPTKLVYRLPLGPNSDKDLVLALAPYDDCYVAKTVWLNEVSDRHTTLNMKRYTKP
jgi:hypothetical protein